MKLYTLLAFLTLSSTLYAQQSDKQEDGRQRDIPRMVDPSIDAAGEPFSYPSRSTDQLSVMHATSGAEITPEGTLYTGFGELLFFLGPDRVPVHQRLRTLEDGYLPIFHYTVQHDGLEYRFTFFAASLGPEQTGKDVVNFVRIAVHNPGAKSARGFVTTAWCYEGAQTTTFPAGDNRFQRPRAPRFEGDKQQPGELFRPDSTYSVLQNAVLRDSKAVYFFPDHPKPQIAASLNGYYNRYEPLGAPYTVQPTTPMAAVEYVVDVPPGAERVLDFKVPLLPVTAADPMFRAVAAADLSERQQQVKSFWQGMLARGMTITVPEPKVNDTFRTSLINDLSALNKVGDDYVQTINQLQYHGFYLRDSADFVRMYDTSGYPDIGRQVVNFFAKRQQPDGNFLSQPGQYDGWGESLWTYGEHFRITHDKAFAAEVYPRIVHAVAWLQQAMAADPLHILPATDVRDNEYIAGHLTGYNFLALDGLNAAERIAHALGHTDDEERFRAVEQQLRTNFFHQLDIITAKTGGYIPPALDGDMGGTDWGNLLSVVPEQQLSPQDPRVTATLRRTQSMYQEGLITYRQPDQGTYLHHYLTIKNTLTELVRGDQEQAIREFYAELMHTSSTNAGWEYSVRPWGDRDFSGNLAPHGWFAAEFRNLLRNMLVREEGNDLHLLSALSPDWIDAGKSVHVDHAATYFGQYGFELQMPSANEAVLELRPMYDAGYAPAHVIVHVPWFMEVTAVRVDGNNSPLPANGLLELAPQAKRVELTWKKHPLSADTPGRYTDAVARYKLEYGRRWEQMQSGVVLP